MTQITFYFHPLSQPSRAVFSLILLGNVPADLRVLEFGVDNKKPEYLAINPFGTMPCLIDNTTIVIESMTILRYLCRTQKSCAKYYPTDPKEALKVDIYMDWHHSGTRPPCVGFFGASIGWKIFGGKQPEKKVLEEAQAKFEKALESIENVFLGGERKYRFINNAEAVTIADLMAIEELAMMFMSNYSFEKFPNIYNWMLTMFSITEVRKACEYLFHLVKTHNPKPHENIAKILGD